MISNRCWLSVTCMTLASASYLGHMIIDSKEIGMCASGLTVQWPRLADRTISLKLGCPIWYPPGLIIARFC